MANRLTTENINNDVLVIEFLMGTQFVSVKENETLEKGDILIFDKDLKKYEKYVKATHKEKLTDSILRVYVGENTTTKENDLIEVVQQAILNQALVKGIDTTKDADDYKLIANLENKNIILRDVK